MTIAPRRSPRLPLVRTPPPPAWRDGFPAYIKVQPGVLQSKGSGLTGFPDEPAACIGHQDRERHDRRLEFPASRARERLRHAHPLDRLDLVRIRSPFRGLAFLREEEVQRPLQIGGQVVPGVHLEELRSLVSRLFQEFAPRTRLGGLSVPRRPARQRLDDSPEPVPVLAGEDDLLLRGDREAGGRGPEVHPDPPLPGAARQFDLLLRDRRPSLAQRLGRQDAGLRRHGDPGGTATRLLIAVDAPSVWIAVLRAQLLLRATRVSAADAPPILEERQAREGEAGREKGGAEGKAESATGREARADREGCEGRTRGEETGGEARAAGGAAETRRGRGLRNRSPRRS